VPDLLDIGVSLLTFAASEVSNAGPGPLRVTGSGARHDRPLEALQRTDASYCVDQLVETGEAAGIAVDIKVTLVGPQAGDEARELRHWLTYEAELRGRVRLIEPAPEPGSLGALVDTLVVSLGPGGATAFATALVSWIRHRTGDTRAVVRQPDGTQVEVSARRVRGLDAAAVRSIVQDVSRSVRANGGEIGDDGDPTGS
jgi:Effector Associated Constant Component 1